MATKNAVAFEYCDDAVQFDSQTHLFFVPSLEHYYDTAQQAKDAIDRKQTAEKRVAKKSINLPVIGSDLIERSITGVHAGRSQPIFKPQPEKYGPSVKHYPRIAWIKSAIEKYEQLKAQAEDIEDAISKFVIDEPYRLPGELDEQYKAVEADYEKKRKLAAATDLEKELAKVKRE